ncbi:MAG: hypothetical protein C0467_15055 [Planctomycetaceae bacterium]|nr:hypothetical protein [Planctomycetaceae bacterium]
MNQAGRRWWLRSLAAVLGGGSAVTGAWVGFSRPAVADQNAPLALVGEPLTGDNRPAATEPFERPRDTSVIPITATTPAALPAPVEPVVPVTPPPMGLQPPASLPLPPVPATIPVTPAMPVIPVAAPFPPNEIPQLPTPSLPAIPKTPSVPAIPPAEATKPTPPAIPAPPSVVPPVTSPVVPVVPASPVLPLPTPVPSTVPAVPPAPAIPAVPDFGPSVSPPAGLTPPPLPSKIAEPALSSLPAKPDSSLPTGKEGINVKTDKVGGNTGSKVPVAPAPVPVKPPVEPVKLPIEPPLAGTNLPGGPSLTTPTEAIVDRPKPVETPLREPEKNTFPIPSNPLVQTPGDNTMIPLSRSAAAAVLGGMLLTPPTPAQAVAPVVPFPTVPAAAPAAPIQADDKTDSAELKKQLEESNRKLSTIQNQLSQLTELLNGKRDEKGFPLPSDPGLVSQMKELKDRLAQIEKDLTNYKSQTALKPVPTNPNPIVDPKVGKGTIRVVNEYPVQISIVVNGTSYRIAPSKSLDVDVAQGEFSYQLLESGAAVTKSVIKEKETVTLRIK